MRVVTTLSSGASRQALEAAIRTQAGIVLDLPDFPEKTIHGLLISGDDRALLLEVTSPALSSPETLLNAQATATIGAESRYQFSTQITGTPRYGRSTLLAIVKPRKLAVLERRRFVRARLAPSSRVVIRWRAGEEQHSHNASLLNVSAEGLACRLAGDTASDIKQGTRLRVAFELPGQQGQFDLEAAVMNKVPASEGCVILGLRFQENSTSLEQVAVLRAFLEKVTDPRRAVEACV